MAIAAPADGHDVGRGVPRPSTRATPPATRLRVEQDAAATPTRVDRLVAARQTAVGTAVRYVAMLREQLGERYMAPARDGGRGGWWTRMPAQAGELTSCDGLDCRVRGGEVIEIALPMLLNHRRRPRTSQHCAPPGQTDPGESATTCARLQAAPRPRGPTRPSRCCQPRRPDLTKDRPSPI